MSPQPCLLFQHASTSTVSRTWLTFTIIAPLLFLLTVLLMVPNFRCWRHSGAAPRTYEDYATPNHHLPPCRYRHHTLAGCLLELFYPWRKELRRDLPLYRVVAVAGRRLRAGQGLFVMAVVVFWLQWAATHAKTTCCCRSLSSSSSSSSSSGEEEGQDSHKSAPLWILLWVYHLPLFGFMAPMVWELGKQRGWLKAQYKAKGPQTMTPGALLAVQTGHVTLAARELFGEGYSMAESTRVETRTSQKETSGPVGDSEGATAGDNENVVGCSAAAEQIGGGDGCPSEGLGIAVPMTAMTAAGASSISPSVTNGLQLPGGCLSRSEPQEGAVQQVREELCGSGRSGTAKDVSQPQTKGATTAVTTLAASNASTSANGQVSLKDGIVDDAFGGSPEISCASNEGDEEDSERPWPLSTPALSSPFYKRPSTRPRLYNMENTSFASRVKSKEGRPC